MTTKKKSSKLLIIFTAVFALVALIYVVIIQSNILSNSDFPLQVIGTLIGMVLSAFITVLLLQGQTAVEEENDIGRRIFDKKQEVYFGFIETLEKITQDGKLNVPGLAGYEKPKSENDVNDELQHLIYQLGKVQMTASQDTSRKVTGKIGNLLKIIQSNDKNNGEVYSEFAGILFEIVADLRKDLFDTNSEIKVKHEFEPITKDFIFETLKIAGLGASLKKIESDENVASSYFNFVVDELRASYPGTTFVRIDFICWNERHEDITSLEAAQHFLKADKKDKCVQIVIPKDGAKRVAIEFLNSRNPKYYGLIQGGLQNPKWVVDKKFSQDKMKKIDFVHKDEAYQVFKSADDNGRRQIAKEMLDSCDILRELLESN